MHKTQQGTNQDPLLVSIPNYNKSNLKRSSSNVGLIVGGFAIVSVIGIVILLLLLSLPIIALVIGLHYRDPRYCPIEPRISLFLIVHGSVSIGCLIGNILFGVIVLLFIRRDSSLAVTLNFNSSIFTYTHVIFVWVWLIIGGVWTFSLSDAVVDVLLFVAARRNKLEHFIFH
ncbi:unnamed protein product [Rotaria sp. Silwood1]|nr:unnamed protein product [Rotaria sp. Silwood1]CAF1679962.1 unnamed protein product [Rotaria sp. Silwood1]CAF3957928.1 unnamed protein product [Rotaria sp. Silwood1]CAF5147495.1 unnamed protein product [Rotaria sp. Silwood1]